MELKTTEHSYYCKDGNHYSNGCFFRYENWKEFQEEWLEGFVDHDYNHCFRYDITNEDEEKVNDFSLKLYFMQQRIGRFVAVTINNITEKDMPEIEEYLESCWGYLQNQWEEFSK